MNDEPPFTFPKILISGCKNCRYNTGLSPNITVVHDGVKYECKMCEYRVSMHDTLTSHIQSVHDGVNFDCNQ